LFWILNCTFGHHEQRCYCIFWSFQGSSVCLLMQMTQKDLTWHVDERNCDGMLRHPADSSQWKKINHLYPEYKKEPRNLRLGLATNEMNPFGSLRNQHSLWPILFVIYNLPPWLCMKQKYMMFCMMIFGPKQLGNDIDVYLSPLVEDLTNLWDEGVVVYDGYWNETFKLCAMLLCTMIFQHTRIWVDTVLRDIVHALSVKNTQATYNWNMTKKFN